MKLPGKHIYRGDEFIIENFPALQSENCSNLEIDVKYKEAVHAPPRPTIITCNGESTTDLYPHFNSDIDAVKNRCIFVMMRKKMEELIPSRHIGVLIKSGEYLLDIMYRLYKVEAYRKMECEEIFLSDNYYSKINGKYNTDIGFWLIMYIFN